MAKLAICERCGQMGKGRNVAPGSFLIEAILWIAFCVPGMIYSAWRVKAARRQCEACGSPELVPLDSPRGAMLARSYQLPPGR